MNGIERLFGIFKLAEMQRRQAGHLSKELAHARLVGKAIAGRKFLHSHAGNYQVGLYGPQQKRRDYFLSLATCLRLAYFAQILGGYTQLGCIESHFVFGSHILADKTHKAPEISIGR